LTRARGDALFSRRVPCVRHPKRAKKRILSARVLGFVVWACVAQASGAASAAEEQCLDPNAELGAAGARKGVQQRDFLKRLRAEVSVFGGFWASDLLSSSYDYGGAIAFYPFEDIGAEISL